MGQVVNLLKAQWDRFPPEKQAYVRWYLEEEGLWEDVREILGYGDEED